MVAGFVSLLLGGDTAVSSRLLARLFHAFLVIYFLMVDSGAPVAQQLMD